MPSAQEIEAMNKHIYQKRYTPAQGSIPQEENTYSHNLVLLRLELLRRFGAGKEVLDVCCGTGDYLFQTQKAIKTGTGIDFSDQMIREAEQKKKHHPADNLHFLQGDATKLPFKDNRFGLVYSFSSLYYIPNISQVVQEIARVLKPGGTALLEFGNLYSLNTIVCKAEPNVAISCHIPVSEMCSMLATAGLTVTEKMQFQILPLWGSRPWWLKPLLHPAWSRLMKQRLGSKMLDQHISGLPLVRELAFRQLFVCQKGV